MTVSSAKLASDLNCDEDCELALLSQQLKGMASTSVERWMDGQGGFCKGMAMA